MLNPFEEGFSQDLQDLASPPMRILSVNFKEAPDSPIINYDTLQLDQHGNDLEEEDLNLITRLPDNYQSQQDKQVIAPRFTSPCQWRNDLEQGTNDKCKEQQVLTVSSKVSNSTSVNTFSQENTNSLEFKTKTHTKGCNFITTCGKQVGGRTIIKSVLGLDDQRSNASSCDHIVPFALPYQIGDKQEANCRNGPSFCFNFDDEPLRRKSNDREQNSEIIDTEKVKSPLVINADDYLEMSPKRKFNINSQTGSPSQTTSNFIDGKKQQCFAKLNGKRILV